MASATSALDLVPEWDAHDRFASLNGIYSIWRRDVIRFVRDRSRLVGSLGQPLLFLVVFGSGLSSAMGRLGQAGGLPGLNYVQFMFPGIVVMAVLFTAIMSSISVVWDREFGFLKEVLVAPIPRWAVAVGKALGGSTTAVFQGVIILVFAPFIGAGLTPLAVVELLPAMFLTAFAMAAVGLVIAARLKTMEGFQVIMNFLLMPMFFLSGALFPLSNLPVWLTVLTRVNPVTYGVDAIRRIVLLNAGQPRALVDQLGVTVFGQPLTTQLDLLVLAVFASVMIVLAMCAFQVQD